jgi:two-component sensor histidine kinase
MTSAQVDLNEPLPYPSKLRWGYQHYPVFSLKWWKGRALVFGFGVVAFALMSGMGAIFEFDSTLAAVKMALVFFVGVMGMVITGATLATLSRTYIKFGTLQRVFVTLSMFAGILGAALFDSWSSSKIEDSFKAHSENSRQIIEATTEQQLGMPAQVINALFGLGLYFWLAGGIAYIRYWREPAQLAGHNSALELTAAKADKHAVQAQLSVLQAQIEPHFLFNTLASVKSVLRADPALAESTIDDLVDYLRASIPRLDGNHRVQPVSLKQQVELCRKYLKIMQLRMGERLEFETKVSFDVEHVEFPPLVVISLVENAIKHGIEPKLSGGKITIQADNVEQALQVDVIDSGVGLNNQVTAGLSSGVGLRNIREQLRVLYGDRAELEISGNSSGGVTATLRILNEAV